MLRFAIVGGSGTLLNLALMFVLTDICKLHYFISCVIVFFIVVTSNYCLNTIWTFKQNKLIYGWFKYVMISFAALIINELCLLIFSHFLNLWYLISISIGILCGFFFNYFMSRRMIWN